MNHIRNNIKDNFAQIPNALINDNTLSDRARFIFCYMAAKSDDWKFYQDKMAKDLQMSVDTVRKYIAELLKSGWVTREEIRGERGVFDSFIYDLHPSPCRKNTESVKNGVGKNPSPLNSALTNTILLQTKTSTNKEEDKEEPQNENDLLVETVKEVDGFIESTYEIMPHDIEGNDEFILPSTQEQTPTPNSAAPPSPKKAKSQKYIYPPTIEELIQPIYEKLLAKKRDHPQIVDCWNWANHQAEAFWLYHDKTGWKVEKLNGAIATWINKAIQYKTVIVPCPIQYKGNPANAQPAQPTKPHVEERPVLTQHDIEYSQAAFAGVEAMFKQMGV